MAVAICGGKPALVAAQPHPAADAEHLFHCPDVRSAANAHSWQRDALTAYTCMIRNQAQDTVMRILLRTLSAWSFIAVVFAVLAAALAIVGYLVFDYQRNAITRNVEQRLATVAELRTQQIASWVSVRRANAKV